MMRTEPTQTDIASIHEEWLLRYCNVKEAFEKRNAKGNDNNVTHNNLKQEELCDAAISVRAGRMGVLEWGAGIGITAGRTVEGKENNDNNNNKEIDALRHLLDHTRLEMDEDAISSETQKQALESLIAQQMSTMQTASTASTTHVKVISPGGTHVGTTNNSDNSDVDDDAMVNIFFEEYPECIRTDINISHNNNNVSDTDSDTYNINDNSFSSSSSSSSDGDYYNYYTNSDNDTDSDTGGHSSVRRHRKRRPLSVETTKPAMLPNPSTATNDDCYDNDLSTLTPMNQFSNGNNDINNIRYKMEDNNHDNIVCNISKMKKQQSQQQQQQQPFNPYQQKQKPNYTRHNSQNQQQQQHNNYHQQQRQQYFYQQQQQQQHHPDWEVHRNEQNPFQTAREYKLVEDRNNNKKNNHNHKNQQQYYNHSNNNSNPNNNIYTNLYDAKQDDDEVIVMDGVQATSITTNSNIRESLKRKFQPPKRNTYNNNNQTASSGGSVGSNNNRKMTQSRKTIIGKNTNMKNSNSDNSTQNNSSNTKKGSTKNNDHSDGDNDDDELPEELKRYGKELVDKILNEILDNGESITFDDIAGLKDAKQIIHELVVWPMKRPDLFTGLRKAPNGLLLYGPPGTGKTLIGKAIAHESGATFFSISSSSLTSKWIGEGEKLVRTLFAVAVYKEPAVIFIDEIDSLLTQRKSDENEASRRIKTEFLIQLDGCTSANSNSRVLVIGATNRPQELDEAVRRRFVKRLYIPLPEIEDREILLKVMLNKSNKSNINNYHKLSNFDIRKLAKDTDGYSGADLKSLCTDAAMGPIRQLGPKALEIADVNDIPPISYKHFKRSLKTMKPSVGQADLIHYIEWDRIYGTKLRRPSGDDNEDDDSDDDDDDNDNTEGDNHD